MFKKNIDIDIHCSKNKSSKICIYSLLYPSAMYMISFGRGQFRLLFDVGLSL